MADDLIDFSELENDENCCPEEDQENKVPKLLQPPVIVNPILKQSTKDNLIQLYTPVQRPVKGKLKVTFGEDSLLQTPVVKKGEKRAVQLDVTIKEVKERESAVDKEKQEREEWEERTSILTSIDHQDYTTYARDFIEEIIQSLPVKEDGIQSVDVGGVESMDYAEYETEPIHFPVASDTNQNCNAEDTEAEMSFTTNVLPYATDLLKSLQQKNESKDKSPEGFHVAKESLTAAESEEEFMDCEEYMEVDNELAVPQSKETMPQSTEAVIQSSETIPQNSETAIQNSETVPQSTEKAIQSSEKVPQSTETVIESIETVPQSTETAVQSSETVPQSTETVMQSSKTVLQSTKTVIQSNDTVPQNEEKLPQNNETAPQNPGTSPQNSGIAQNHFTDNSHEISSSYETNIAGEPCVENKETGPYNIVQTNNAESKQDLNNIGNSMHEETASLKEDHPGRKSETLEATTDEQNLDKKSINDDQTNEANVKYIPVSIIEEQPILQKKGFYNLDELDLESLDPFKPKAQITNTPDKISQDKNAPMDNGEKDVNRATCVISGEGNSTEKSVDNFDVKAAGAVSEKAEFPKSEVVIATQCDNTLNKTGETGPSEIQNEEQKEVISDVSSERKPNESVPANSIEEEPILPKKGFYNFDELDLESMDPFKPKAQILITPDKSTQGKTVMEGQNKNTGNGTGESQKGEMKTEGQEQVNSDKIQESAKTQYMDLNVCTMKKLPTMQEQKPSEQIPIDSKSNNFEEIEDPFKPRRQMQNSPVIPVRTVGMSETDSTGMTTECEKTHVTENMTADASDVKGTDLKLNSAGPQDFNQTEDHFKIEKVVSSQAANSTKLEEHPVKQGDKHQTKTHLQSAPPQEETENVIFDKKECENKSKTSPSKALIQPQNSEAQYEVKEQVIENPPKISKKFEKVQDSEPGPTGEQDFAEIDDPFKPRKQMQNSPVKKEPATSAVNFDQIEDPFKPSKQMQNSPTTKTTNYTEKLKGDDISTVQKQGQDSTVAKDLNSKFEDTVDPFKPKNQMQNSPVINKKVLESGGDSQDAFKTNSKLANSPVSVNVNANDCNDPETSLRLQGDVKSSKKDQDYTLGLLEMESLDDIEDPFEPRKQMQSSPPSKQNIEVYSEKGQPDILKEKSPAKSVADPKLNAFDDIDPFKTYRQMPKTPDNDKVRDNRDVENNECAEETPKAEQMDGLSSAEKDVKTPTNENKPTVMEAGAAVKIEPVEEDDGCIEITSVTRRSDLPKDAKIGNFDELSIDESQFVSAAKVFNEPGMLDLLEQFGSTSSNQESSLSRMSLYVKFDPLVEAAPNPRRISIRPDQLGKMREYGLDETLLLLGTPPKKKRQSMSVSFLKNTPDRRLTLDKRIGPVRVEPGEVDLILACSPGEVKEETQTCSNISPFCPLVEDIAAVDTGIFEELKYTDTDLKKMRNNLKMEMEGILLEKKREFYAKEQEMKRGMDKMETVITELKKKRKSLEERATGLKRVLDMFDQTFIEVEEKQKAELKKIEQEKNKLKEERDTVLNDNLSVEKAFKDLHARYDKLKDVLDGFRKNEEALKKCISECQENITANDKKLATMKKTYEDKCKQLHQDCEKYKQQYEDSASKSDARCKVLQVKIERLEKQLEQRVAENKELTEICDKLLAEHPDS